MTPRTSEFGRAVPRQVEVRLGQPTDVEVAGADDHLEDVLNLADAPLPELVRDRDVDRLAVVGEGLLAWLQSLAADVAEHREDAEGVGQVEQADVEDLSPAFLSRIVTRGLSTRPRPRVYSSRISDPVSGSTVLEDLDLQLVSPDRGGGVV